MMSDAKFVENLLNELPIVELRDQRQRNALIATLLNGEKRMIEFEKTIVPAKVIVKFVLVDHVFPIPMGPLSRHFVEEIDSYLNYSVAKDAFWNRSIETGAGKDGLNRIMLVGEFKGQHLDF